MKNLFISSIACIFESVSLPERIRDFFMWPLATRVLGASFHEVIVLRAGFSIRAYLGDQLGRLAVFYGAKKRYFWEPATTQLLEKLVRGTGHIIVAGSHIGLTALYARAAMTPAGIVHAFEPIPHLYEQSLQNFERNARLGRIQLTNCALGNVPGEVIMTEDRIRSRIVQSTEVGKGLSTTRVPITTIDAYCAREGIRSVDLVFLDVEGYELNALQGARDTFKQKPPRDIIYEISLPYKDDLRAARDIESYLGPFGYSFYIVDESYDPTYYKDNLRTVNLVPTSEKIYRQYRSIRYFNVYATLRDVSSLPQLGSVTIGEPRQ